MRNRKLLSVVNLPLLLAVFTAALVPANTPIALTKSKKAEINSNNARHQKMVMIRPEKISLTVMKAATPLIDPNLIIVNPRKRVLTVNGLHGKHTAFGIPYDRNLVPEGYWLSDIKTFAYDKQAKKWQELPKLGIDTGKSLMYAKLHADGPVINGIVRAPESPQEVSATPTQLKNIALGNPASGLTTMTLPVANQQGSASLVYSIELPQGRQGIQPALNLTYNSDQGKGLLGEGWDLQASSITTDTRWGAPRFDQTNETETYNLDGEMLAFMSGEAARLPHRDPGIARISERQFYPRREKDFERILRHGSDPATYWWEIIDRKGTKRIYGAQRKWVLHSLPGHTTYTSSYELDENALICDPVHHHIAEWKLTRVEDIFGNCLTYTYQKDNTLNSNGIPLANSAIAEISYTGSEKENASALIPANYLVKFELTQTTDYLINARYGFLTANPHLLKGITIKLVHLDNPSRDTDRLIRSYAMTYTTGAFNKTLLASVAQSGAGNQVLGTHTFDYNNNITGGLYEAAQPWDTHTAGLDNIIPAVLPGSQTTAIGGNISQGNSLGLYAGLGFNDFRINDRSLTVGFNGSFGQTHTTGVNTLIDIDGDGLPDEVFTSGGRLGYHKNTGNGFSADIIWALGPLGEFQEGSDYHTSTGLSAYFGANLTLSHSSGEQSLSTYFSDVNGDGLIDVVKDGAVYFNHLENGIPVFDRASSLTAVPLTGGAVTIADPINYATKSLELAKDNPMLDVVRLWEAPFNGRIHIGAPVSLMLPQVNTLNPRDLDIYNRLADGVTVAVQKNGQTLGRTTIPSHSQNVYDMPFDVDVSAGDRIYFRVMSGTGTLANGDFDQVNWRPVIDYVSDNTVPVAQLPKRIDVFGKNAYHYDVTADYLLSNEGGLKVPATQTVQLGGAFNKQVTLSDISIQIIQYSENPADPIVNAQGQLVPDPDGVQHYKYTLADTILSKRFPKGQAFSALTADPLVFSMKKGTFLAFRVKSNVNADLDQVSWTPMLSAQVSTPDNQSIKMSVVPEFQFRAQMKYRAELWPAIDTQQYTLQPMLRFNAQGHGNGSGYFTLRQGAQIIKKIPMKFAGGTPFIDPTFKFPLNQGDLVYGAFETADTTLSNYTTEAVLMVKNLAVKNAAVAGGSAGEVFKAPDNGNFMINHDLAFTADTTVNVTYTITINGAVAKAGQLKFHHQQTVIQGDVVYASKNDLVKLNYTVPAPPAGVQPLPVSRARFLVDQQLNADLWINLTDKKYGPMFRGWGQFTYNDPNNRANDDIQESLLIEPAADQNSVQQTQSSVINQINTGQGNLSVDPTMTAMDAYDPRKKIFGEMPADAQGEIRRWKGADDAVYLDKEVASSSRLGLKEVNAHSPFPIGQPLAGTAAGVTKVTSTHNNNYNGGYGSLGASRSSGGADNISDFFDLNGDRFPDVIGSSDIQLTDASGKLSNDHYPAFFHSSENSSTGAGLSGVTPGSASSNSVANGRVGSSATVQSSQNSGSANAAASRASASFGMSGSIDIGQDDAKFTWLDINGDGLPDKVQNNGQVALNLGTPGNPFLPFANWPQLSSITVGHSITVSPGLSLSFDNGDNSISGGIGLTASRSGASEYLQDVNGDGLVDQLKLNGNVLDVEINTGHGFVNYPGWLTLSEAADLGIIPGLGGYLTNWNTATSASAGNSIGGSFTFGFFFGPIIPLFKASFSPSYYHTNGLGSTLRQIIDINGDGFPDYVFSDSQDKLYVRLSKIGSTNKLSAVHGPLGLNIAIHYSHSQPTAAHPGGKLVMSEVLADGGAPEVRLTNTGFDLRRTFEYANGRYDAYERQFLGFGTVSTNEWGFDATIQRKSIATYDNRSYYTTTNQISELISDGQSKPYLRTDYSYAYILANPAADYSSNAVDTIPMFLNAICFTPVKKVANYAFNHVNIATFLNSSAFTYNNRGNNTTYDYKDNGPTPGYTLTKTFKAYDPVTGVFSLLTDYTIAAGRVLRKGSATYFSNGRMSSSTTAISAAVAGQTVFDYNGEGNLQHTRLPNGLEFTYTYDEDLNTFIKSVTDNRTYNSETNYNPSFGLPLTTTDINGNKTAYSYDDFGRCIAIKGPLEYDNPDPKVFTLRFVYDPNLQETHCWTKTYHFDKNQPDSAIFFETFIDGMKRQLQVKKSADIYSSPGKFITSGRVLFDGLGRAAANYYPSSETSPDYVINASPVYKGFGTLSFDALNRQLSVTLPDPAHTVIQSTVYDVNGDGMLTECTTLHNGSTGKDQVATETFDGSGLKIKKQLAHNGTLLTTLYTYDAVHQLTVVKSPNNAVNEWTYFWNGAIKSYSGADLGQQIFTYNADGTLHSKKQGDGETISYAYELDHLISTSYSTHPKAMISYKYGAQGGQQHNLGRLVYVEDEISGQAFDYDAMGNIIFTKRTIAAPNNHLFTYNFKYQYDSWGRLLEMTYPGNEAVRYQYDRGGLLKAVTSSQRDPYVRRIAYDEFEQKKLMIYGNQTKTNYSYNDTLRRLKNIAFAFASGSSSMSYSYDQIGNIASSANQSLAGSGISDAHVIHQFGYDDIGELTTAKGTSNADSYQLTMAYDNAFNIRQKTLTLEAAQLKRSYDLTYNSRPESNKIDNVTETANRSSKPFAATDAFYLEHNRYDYAYDQNGNNSGFQQTDVDTKRSGVKRTQMTFGEENRLASVNLNGLVSHYFYDYQGERTLRLSEQSDHIFVNGQLSGEKLTSATYAIEVNPFFSTRNGGSLYSKHIYAGELRVASVTDQFENNVAEVAAYPGRDPDDAAAHFKLKLADVNASVQETYDRYDLPHPHFSAQNFAAPATKNPELVNPDAKDNRLPADTAKDLIYYYHVNPVQSVNYVSNKDGQVVQYIEYLPFGETFLEQRKGYSSAYTFSGKQTDPETGLQYFGARYLDPKFSLWLSVDPEEAKYPGASPYSFSLNNPVGFQDRNGRDVTFQDGVSLAKDLNVPLAPLFKKDKSDDEHKSAIYGAVNSVTQIASPKIGGELIKDVSDATGVLGVVYDIKNNINEAAEGKITNDVAAYRSGKSYLAFEIGDFASTAAGAGFTGVAAGIGAPIAFGAYAWGVEQELQMFKGFLQLMNERIENIPQKMMETGGFAY